MSQWKPVSSQDRLEFADCQLCHLRLMHVTGRPWIHATPRALGHEPTPDPDSVSSPETQGRVMEIWTS